MSGVGLTVLGDKCEFRGPNCQNWGEREIVSNEGVRERDWWREFKGEANVDEKRGAVLKSPKIGDVVLLRAEKNNKLPSFFWKITIPQEGSNSSVENGGNGNALADAGKEHGKGTSDAEVNMENERVDVGYKDQEIRQHQKVRGSMRQTRRSARFKGFVLN